MLHMKIPKWLVTRFFCCMLDKHDLLDVLRAVLSLTNHNFYNLCDILSGLDILILWLNLAVMVKLALIGLRTLLIPFTTRKYVLDAR